MSSTNSLSQQVAKPVSFLTFCSRGCDKPDECLASYAFFLLWAAKFSTKFPRWLLTVSVDKCWLGSAQYVPELFYNEWLPAGAENTLKKDVRNKWSGSSKTEENASRG